MTRRNTLSIAAALLLVAIVGSPAYAQVRYKLTALGDLTGPTVEGFSDPNAINDKGEVVGLTSNDERVPRAFLWRHGQMFDLGSLLPDEPAVANAINNRSVVVGSHLWRRGDVTTVPDLPGGLVAAIASDVNNRGQIIGRSHTDDGFEGFLLQRGALISLDTLARGSFQTEPMAINERGEIVGLMDTSEGLRAFLWQQGALTVIDPLSSGDPAADTTIASDINNQGQIVGEVSEAAFTAQRGFLWEEGRMRLLPPPPGFDGSLALAINEREQIVGMSFSSVTSELVAVLWEAGVPSDLNELIRANDPLAPFVTLRVPRGINERGQIIASGFDSRLGGAGRAYLLTPTHVRH